MRVWNRLGPKGGAQNHIADSVEGWRVLQAGACGMGSMREFPWWNGSCSGGVAVEIAGA